MPDAVLRHAVLHPMADPTLNYPQPAPANSALDIPAPGRSPPEASSFPSPFAARAGRRAGAPAPRAPLGEHPDVHPQVMHLGKDTPYKIWDIEGVGNYKKLVVASDIDHPFYKVIEDGATS